MIHKEIYLHLHESMNLVFYAQEKKIEFKTFTLSIKIHGVSGRLLSLICYTKSLFFLNFRALFGITFKKAFNYKNTK